MAYQHYIELDEKNKLINVEVSGHIDRSAYIAIGEEVVAIYNENHFNVFYDFSGSSLDQDIETLTQAPREIKGKSTKVAHEILIAAYVSKKDYNGWKFLEILYLGMGYPLKIFTDKDEALQWLPHSAASTGAKK